MSRSCWFSGYHEPVVFSTLSVCAVVQCHTGVVSDRLGLVGSFVAILPWSMPSPIGAAWSANGSWRTALMSLFAFTNAWIIYYPFFKVHERLLLENKRTVMQKRVIKLQ